MERIQERKGWAVNGYLGLVVGLGLIALGIRTVISDGPWLPPVLFISGVLVLIGLFVVQPNEARALVLFGNYVGTVRQAGLWWTNPFAAKKHVSLRIHNFNSERLKVNDGMGNPIEIAAVIVWRVVYSAKALFDVENYEQFVAIQTETAIRTLASQHPHDSHEPGTSSIRGNPDQVAEELRSQVQPRLDVAGVEVLETRLSHLAYAPEIAQVMLRRQQAEAIIAARQRIVEGAVGMVQMALKMLSEQDVVTLDEEKRATMVNNLLTVLVAEKDAQPVINTGTLYQ
ncbi:MAG: SPFH domain-containing protein [bacterium]